MNTPLTAVELVHRLHDAYADKIKPALTAQNYVEAGVALANYAFWMNQQADLGRVHCGPALVDTTLALSRTLMKDRTPAESDTTLFKVYFAQSKLPRRE
ncbi:hypothetical protein J4211_01125 [Candidatus Woesearchaeota archaeon]|nr:hypothetical protein [Candidatus Woesearchaeota archaeon]